MLAREKQKNKMNFTGSIYLLLTVLNDMRWTKHMVISPWTTLKYWGKRELSFSELGDLLRSRQWVRAMKCKSSSSNFFFQPSMSDILNPRLPMTTHGKRSPHPASPLLSFCGWMHLKDRFGFFLIFFLCGQTFSTCFKSRLHSYRRGSALLNLS